MALIDRFSPHLLFAFDPLSGDGTVQFGYGAGFIVYRSMAAWTHDGEVFFQRAGTRSGVLGAGSAGDAVPCFDLAVWLKVLPAPIVLKIDAEGAEYPLLHRIAEEGVDRHLDRILVEWHTGDLAHGLEQEKPVLGCPVEAWA